MNKILSLDGGGLKGLQTCQILIALEERLGGRIANYVDFVAGTSTGGLITSMILHPKKYTTQDVSDLFEEYGSTIFNPNSMRALFSYVYGPKYSAGGLNDVLRKYIGHTRLSELVKPAIITSYDLLARKVKIFAKTDRAKYGDAGDYYLKDVCRATSAAETYFSPAKIKSLSGQNYTLVDGGNANNSPALCAYSEMVSNHKLRTKDMLLISIGTGEVCKPIRANNYGDIQWIKPALDIMMSAQSEVVDFHLSNIFAFEGEYYRLQFKDMGAASTEMDNSLPDNIQALKANGKKFVNANSNTLDMLALKLKKAH